VSSNDASSSERGNISEDNDVADPMSQIDGLGQKQDTVRRQQIQPSTDAHRYLVHLLMRLSQLLCMQEFARAQWLGESEADYET